MLGRDYVVWDKAATIRFRKPGRGMLSATFRVRAEDVAQIRQAVQTAGKAEREFTVELVGADGVVHASCQKLLSIRAR